MMNSWGFCDWFNARTPANLLFEQAYAKRALRLDKLRVLAEADVKPVPSHSTTEGGKSATVVAHQLLKRNRNLRYEKRKGQRMPPSVMMAAFAGATDVPSGSIAGALDAISAAMLDALETAGASAGSSTCATPGAVMIVLPIAGPKITPPSAPTSTTLSYSAGSSLP